MRRVTIPAPKIIGALDPNVQPSPGQIMTTGTLVLILMDWISTGSGITIEQLSATLSAQYGIITSSRSMAMAIAPLRLEGLVSIVDMVGQNKKPSMVLALTDRGRLVAEARRNILTALLNEPPQVE